MIEVTYSATEKARIRVSPVTTSGGPAKIQAGSLVVTPTAGSGQALNPVVEIEGDDLFTVRTDLPADGVLADLDFEVSGDADLGGGVKTITDVVRTHVTTEQAANLGLAQVEIVPR